MTIILLVLALPLLAAPWISPARPASAATQILFTGLLLAALWQGAGTLDPRDLHDIALHSSSDAWFVGASLGALVTGAVLAAAWREPLQLVAGAPLLLGAWLATTRGMLVPVLVGAIVAIIPLALAQVGPAGIDRETRTAALDRADELLCAMTAVALVVLPLIIAVVLLVVLAWRVVRQRRQWWPVAATTLATTLLAAWCWSAVTVAGTPWMSLPRFAVEAPLSPAASQVLAALSLGALLLVIRPWPLSRVVPSPWFLATAAIALHFVAVTASPAGMAHWQPLLSVLMLLAAAVTAWRGEWDQCAVALLVLSATRPGIAAFSVALALALVPLARRYLTDRRVCAVLAGIVLAVVVGQVLRDEVLVAVVLTLALAVAAHRSDRRVAGIPPVPHL